MTDEVFAEWRRFIDREHIPVQELRDWLTQRGFDGLYSSGECACILNDLVPCADGLGEECTPGYRIACNACDEFDYCISSQKDECWLGKEINKGERRTQ